MSLHFPDASFDAAVSALFDATGRTYGVGASRYHIEVPAERDTVSVFGTHDAESAFYALKALAEQEVKDLRLVQNAQNVFATVAFHFLQEHEYTFEVSQWLATANALIVGVHEYEKRHGHKPVETDAFVLDYIEHGPEFTLADHY